MAVLKVACPKCGQKVSGDDSFFGTTVDCPVCTAKIPFPDPPEEKLADAPIENLQSRGDIDEDRAGSESSDPTPTPEQETASIPLSPPHSSTPVSGDGVPSPVLGVIAMVLGLVSMMLLCIPGILFGPAAIISGHLARSRAKHSPVQPAPGSSAALGGLILGYLSLAGFILVLVVMPSVVEWIRESNAPD